MVEVTKPTGEKPVEEKPAAASALTARKLEIYRIADHPGWNDSSQRAKLSKELIRVGREGTSEEGMAALAVAFEVDAKKVIIEIAKSTEFPEVAAEACKQLPFYAAEITRFRDQEKAKADKVLGNVIKDLVPRVFELAPKIASMVEADNWKYSCQRGDIRNGLMEIGRLSNAPVGMAAVEVAAKLDWNVVAQIARNTEYKEVVEYAAQKFRELYQPKESELTPATPTREAVIEKIIQGINDSRETRHRVKRIGPLRDGTPGS